MSVWPNGRYCGFSYFGFIAEWLYEEEVAEQEEEAEGGLSSLRLHVPGVAKVDARLGGALVGAILQGDDVLAGTQLLLAKVAHILVRLLGTNRWLVEVRGLFKKIRYGALLKRFSLTLSFSLSYSLPYDPVTASR